jgi:four helix bundle protein
MELVVLTYDVTAAMPPVERFGLAQQMRRAAVSVPSNVAEGHAIRTSRKSYRRYVRIALGSLAELDTQLEIAQRLRLIENNKRLDALKAELVRATQILHGLLRSLTTRTAH